MPTSSQPEPAASRRRLAPAFLSVLPAGNLLLALPPIRHPEKDLHLHARPQPSHPKAAAARRLAILALLLLTATAHPQTLAQKNWAGSGVTVETWWHRAVFYRIDPARFQSPDAFNPTDPTQPANLTGLALRLDYIQSLGVDAILLAPPATDPPLTPNAPGWDDLVRAAADHHIRLLVALPAPTSQAPAADANVLALARAWLNQGVAGLYIPLRSIAQVDGAEHIAALLRQLHTLVAAVPGQRILLSEAPPPNADTPITRALTQTVQLTAAAPIQLTQPNAAQLGGQLGGQLRTQLNTALNTPDPLLVATRIPAQPDRTQQATLDRTVATLLLASRAAVLLDAGQELGLLPTADNPNPLMQWTPSNRTQPPPPPPPPAPKPSAPPPDAPFKPYVPPLPRNLFRPPPMPLVVPSEHPSNPRLAPNSLPGFTAGPLPPGTAANAATANVALEDTDPDSLLTLYRHLIQLHHDNPALRNGPQTLLDRDADNALLWLRPAPASTRTAGSVLVACNLSSKPLILDLTTLHLRPIPLHTLLRTLLGTTPIQSRTTLTIPPNTIFLGESPHP